MKGRLVLCKDVTIEALARKLEHDSAQHTLAILTSGINAHRFSYFLSRAALVDMTMQSKQWLVFLNRFANGLAPHGYHFEAAC